jgi:hypothetical protein
MNWEAAMRWARIRAKETGERYAVRGYRRPNGGRWSYVAGRAERR